MLEVNKVTDRDLLEKILTEITSVKDEVGLMKIDLGTVKDEVSLMNTELISVKDQVGLIRTQQQEDHLILNALKHSSEVNRAEHDKMLMEISYIYGNIKSINQNLTAVKEVIGEHEVDIRVLKNRII